MTQSNRSWDFGRFVQTLDFFDSIPVISGLKKMIAGSNAPIRRSLKTASCLTLRNTILSR